MKYVKQKNIYSCAVAAIKNAIIFLKGKPVSFKRISELAGTTPKDGTPPKGIMKALKKLGYTVKNYVTKNEVVFENQLAIFLKRGNPCIVLTSHEDHYITAIKYENGRVYYLDPDRERRKIPYDTTLMKFTILARNLDKEHLDKTYFEFIVVGL